MASLNRPNLEVFHLLRCSGNMPVLRENRRNSPKSRVISAEMSVSADHCVAGTNTI